MENGAEDTPLYCPSLLKDIDWDSRKASFKNDISPTNVGENLVMRPLSLDDYDHGFLQILDQLTTVGDVSKEVFIKRFHSMQSCKGVFYVTVIEDTRTRAVIGTATLVIEQKFIHSAASRGRIEDVVVSSEYRGKQLGKLLVEALTLLGKYLGCYKMSLECKEENIPFYESFGYQPDGQLFMVQRYKD